MVTYRILETPLGEMMAGATDTGLCLLEFTDPERLQRQLPRLQQHLDAPLHEGDHALFQPLSAQLAEYFDGNRREFELPLDLMGTAFQRQAWTALLAIPYGQTRSYQQQAEAIGQPDAVRAVARANGDNRLGIVIPCHRVIGKNGTLTGYGGGLWRKQKLLALEGALDPQTDAQSDLFA
ncbi:methylated-DNA--[protein]-cysteine S-methyltransferase [Saccharospirillum mangrovi]|uniref:methylated-DNA--[protein]-cysteine S-methyltransferase n=1 Tax=Saccharospirillum mangrovi TaxID=2161747 RepID=UPI000D3BD80E|nr:methylated-DNA--[protein]-cysteine S-methyltransferase [Saccharospirillum mangrovi]